MDTIPEWSNSEFPHRCLVLWNFILIIRVYCGLAPRTIWTSMTPFGNQFRVNRTYQVFWNSTQNFEVFPKHLMIKVMWLQDTNGLFICRRMIFHLSSCQRVCFIPKWPWYCQYIFSRWGKILLCVFGMGKFLIYDYLAQNFQSHLKLGIWPCTYIGFLPDLGTKKVGQLVHTEKDP